MENFDFNLPSLLN